MHEWLIRRPLFTLRLVRIVNKVVEFVLDDNGGWNVKNEDGRRALEVGTGKSEGILEN